MTNLTKIAIAAGTGLALTAGAVVAIVKTGKKPEVDMTEVVEAAMDVAEEILETAEV